MKNIAELFACIKAGDIKQVTELVQENQELAHAKDPSGVSAIMFAAYCSRKDIVSYLLNYVKVDLFEAAIIGDAKRIQELLSKNPKAIHEFSSDGFTALHLACFFSNVECVKFLLAHDADANAVAKNPMRVQPLHSAVVRGNKEIVAALLDAGAEVDAKQHGGWTALHAAAASGDVELVQLLLNAEANPHMENDEGKTPVSMAFAKGHSTILRILSSKD